MFLNIFLINRDYCLKNVLFVSYLKNIMKLFYLLIPISTLLVLTTSCKEEDKDTEEDNALYEEITSITEYYFYKNNEDYVVSSDESPHNDYFRVKFNSVANEVLTDNGKLPEDGTFPDGSIIIKELYNEAEGDLQLYAVMKKTDSENTAGGWLWGEYKPEGATFHSVGEKGKGCFSCHTINERDYVRVFNLFP